MLGPQVESECGIRACRAGRICCSSASAAPPTTPPIISRFRPDGWSKWERRSRSRSRSRARTINSDRRPMSALRRTTDSRRTSRHGGNCRQETFASRSPLPRSAASDVYAVPITPASLHSRFYMPAIQSLPCGRKSRPNGMENKSCVRRLLFRNAAPFSRNGCRESPCAWPCCSVSF